MLENIAARLQRLPFGSRTMPYLLLTLAVFAVYIDIYPNTYVYDDMILILHNRFLTSWGYLPDIFTHLNMTGGQSNEGFYRPVPMVLHLALYQLFGPSTIAFHTVNLAFHALNTCLVYRLGRRLGFSGGATFAAALLWGVHPLNTESVTYMCATAAPLLATFCLLGLLALLPDCTPRRSGAEQIPGAFAPRRLCLATVFFLLALGSYETAVVFPALAAACLFLTAPDRLNPAIYIRRTWPLWVISAVYIVVHMLLSTFSQCDDVQVSGYGLYCAHILPRFLTSLATLPAYAHIILYPDHLYIDRGFPVFTSFFSGPVLAGLALAVGALAQIIWGKGKRGLPLSFGVLWFAVALSPTTGILKPASALIFEHWMYLPTIGLFLGVAQASADYLDKSKRVVAAAVPLAVLAAAFLLGLKTISQNEVWFDSSSLYANVFENGGSRRGLANLGWFYINKGEFDKALKTFQQALDNPDYSVAPAAAHIGMAIAYLHIRTDSNYTLTPAEFEQAVPHATNIPEAIDELKKAAATGDDARFSYGLLSSLYKTEGDKGNADFYYNKMKGSN